MQALWPVTLSVIN
jgi:hypothetical protein